MINIFEVNETNKMIEKENLDVRTITLGISLLDCVDSDLSRVNEKIYRKITHAAKNLVQVGEEISREYGIPIVNKRISVTPIALIGGAACKTPADFATIADTLDKAAHEVGVNFIGGYSALVSKGMTSADELLIRSIPMALARTERVCSSVNLGSTKTGINMDAVKLMGEIILEAAEYTKETDSSGCTKLVVFCNAPDDNPFMAGAFHGVTEADQIINVGVSGPGVVKTALEKVRGESFEVLCETIKKTAFKVTRVGQLVAKEASRRLGIPFGIVDLSLAPTPAIGDSVAEGCSSSGHFGHAPYMENWVDQSAKALDEKYTGKVSVKNVAVGGKTSEWGSAAAQINAVASETPDLVMIHFGINDAGGDMTPGTYRDNIEKIVADVQARVPDCEFMLIKAFAPNSANYNYNTFKAYWKKLDEIAESYREAFTLDMFTPSLTLLQNKKYMDVTGNGINHVNDYSSRLYAMNILSALIKY